MLNPRLMLCLLFAALLTGCATAPPPVAVDVSLFRDAQFAPRATPREDIFALSPAMEKFVRGELRKNVQSEGKVEGLLDALYAGGKLMLEYESSKTRTAAETFDARAGNCLSLAIMTAALAREIGLSIQYREVLTDELWMQDRDFLVAAGHVNLTLGRRDMQRKVIGGGNTELIVDFLPRQLLTGQRARVVSEERIVSMYFNNRAAELIVNHEWDAAYWHARDAITADPSYAAPWNALGVIYQRRGDNALAEAAFRKTLSFEPDNTRALANLAALLEQEGRQAEARTMNETLARVQPVAPFKHFRDAKAALARGEYSQARDGFNEALRQNGQYSEIHLGLAAAYLGMGDVDRARQQLEQALEKSTNNRDQQRYAIKRDWLKSLQVR